MIRRRFVVFKCMENHMVTIRGDVQEEVVPVQITKAFENLFKQSPFLLTVP